MAEGTGVTLEELKKKMAEFTKERDWDQFHSPRNLLLAMVGEVGELSEIFQWKGEVPKGLPGWTQKEKEHLGEELSDVLLYLVRLSDICGVDLGKAALRKVELNAQKYPVQRCKGSSNKYNHYTATGENTSNGSANIPIHYAATANANGENTSNGSANIPIHYAATADANGENTSNGSANSPIHYAATADANGENTSNGSANGL